MSKIDGPERAEFVYIKLYFLKIPMDNVQDNTEHYRIHDDTNDEHSV